MVNQSATAATAASAGLAMGTESFTNSKTVESLLGPLLMQINALTLQHGGGENNYNTSNTSGFGSTRSSSTNSSNNGTTSSSCSSTSSMTPTNTNNTKKSGKKKSKHSKSENMEGQKAAHALVATVVDSIEQFVALSGEIAQEHPALCAELTSSIEAVRVQGAHMASMSREFANAPCEPHKRLVMVGASRDLLTAITRLLHIADLIDVQLLCSCIERVQLRLAELKRAENQDELTHLFKQFGTDLVELTSLSGKRQLELSDAKLRDEMAAARASLKKNSLKLFTSSKTMIRHPELSVAQVNHEYVYKEMSDACEQIEGIATQRITGDSIKHLYDEAASLAVALDELDRQVLGIQPHTFNESRMRLKLETQLENIISAVALMADSESTRPQRRDRIVNECNTLRQALQNVLNACIEHKASAQQAASEEEDSDSKLLLVEKIGTTAAELIKETRTLRRQLRKAVIDHISDSFLETQLPIETLIKASKQQQQQKEHEEQDPEAHEKRQAEAIQMFIDQAEKLVEVSSMACSMSSNVEGIKLVRIATIQVQMLMPQVVNASRVCAARPTSKCGAENMDVFRDLWARACRLLTESVDDITQINDFLSVGENHILDDLNRCVMALRDHNAETLDRVAGAIRGRTSRVCQVVQAETDLYEPDEVIQRVLDTAQVLRDQLISNFACAVEFAVGALQAGETPDDNGFIEAARLVYDGVHDVRNAVLMLNEQGMYDAADTESDVDDLEYQMQQHQQQQMAQQAQQQQLILAQQAQQQAQNDWQYRVEQEPEPLQDDQFQKFPEEERQQIQRQLESFRQEKKNFDREVLKWDDKGNDIIVLAKQMCVIMMEMTDFTRGRGPLKTTMDIIAAAKKISDCGAKLDKLAREIADECPESQSKRELDAYLKPIPLFCNQLNIASKVKANVIDVSGEPIITGLDSATSLIISAKNLMTAVVSVVKASYVASTKYTSKQDSKVPIVQWKMKAPEKKPLVLTAKPADVSARVRKASQKKRVEPIKELSEFHA